MKKALGIAGQVLVILTITLGLDYALTATLFWDLKHRWEKADAANLGTYISTPWHHDLMPDRTSTRVWGNILFPWRTDGYGFRTGRCAPGEAEKDRPAIFVIGDSFVEALGSSYEQSFAGLMACAVRKHGKALWNLGVASYSPVIYFRKIRAAAEKLGVQPREIYVFLDLSDIDDEANVYRVWPDDTVHFANEPVPPDGRSRNIPYKGPPFDLGRFLLANFASVHVVYDLFLMSPLSEQLSFGRKRARWSLDPHLMKAWGQRGLDSAARNLDRIVEMCRDWQCRMTLVVYPWPDNIAAHDRDSVQVRYWRDWAALRGVRFIDGFAPFFDEPAESALREYYIRGDVHFSEAGNRLVYETVKKAVGDDW